MCFSLYPQRLSCLDHRIPTEEKYRKNPFCRSAISPIRSLSLASQVNMYGNNSFVGRIAGMILRPYIPGCSADSSARRR